MNAQENNMKKILISLVAGLLLAGCATQQKPTMPENMYHQAAAESALLDRCGTLGYMSPDVAATGFNNISRVIKTYSFDAKRLNALIPNTPTDATKESCNKMAVVIQAAKQKEDQARLNTQQPTTDPVAQTKSTTTYCNRVGTTVMCNSF